MPVSKKIAKGAHHIAYARNGIAERVLKKPVEALTADYTKRQLRIISGDIPLEDVRLNELSQLILKATDRGDESVLETVTLLREQYIHKDDPILKYSEDEAADVLASLEPAWLKQLKERVQSNPAAPFAGVHEPKKISGQNEADECQDEDEEFTRHYSAINQYDETGKFIAQYPSMYSAAKALGISPGGICAAVQGEIRMSGGYQWRRAGDDYPYGKDILSVPRKKSGLHTRKPVEQYTPDGFLYAEYESATAAAYAVRRDRSSITHAIAEGKPCAGFYWKYKDK